MFRKCITFSIALLLFACSRSEISTDSTTEPEISQTESSYSEATESTVLASEVVKNEGAAPVTVAEYTIIADDISDPKERVVDVRLTSQTDENHLRQVSNEIFQDGFRRTSIFFWLPGMHIGAGAWATAKFAPALRIEILGEAESRKPVLAYDASSTVVGTWRDLSLSRVKYVLVESNVGFTMSMMYSDGSNDKFQVEKISAPSGQTKFHDYQTGEDFVINPQGNLDLYSGATLLATMVKYDD